jgi:hypothetical protein
MSKKLILCFLFISNYCFSQNVFYVSSSLGDNRNSGLTSKKPLKFINEFVPGCEYLFKCGDVYYLRIPKVNSNNQYKRVRISSYGNGDLPLITTYKIVKQIAWKASGENIWVAQIDDLSSIEGYQDISDSNVGFLKVQDSIFGNKFASQTSLAKKWDFCSTGGRLYLYSQTNPTHGQKIMIACNYNIIHLSDNMEISNVSLSGSGGHGIKGQNTKNVIISNVVIKEIGGSYLYQGRTLRYGNGIEFGESAENCLVRNCEISNVYDAALTMQGQGQGKYFRNIKFRDNYVFNNEQSLEFWIKGYHSGFINCEVFHNKCTNAGYGWSHDFRDDKDAAAHILVYHWDVDSSSLIIRNNEFIRARSGYLYINPSNSVLFQSMHNKISQSRNVPIIICNRRFNFQGTRILHGITKLEKESTYNYLK